jgi:hypothetical protein
MIDHRGKIGVVLANHSHARALRIRAGPLEFFDPPNLRGQTESSSSNKSHAHSSSTLLQIATDQIFPPRSQHRHELCSSWRGALCRRVRRSGDCKHLSVLNAAHTKIAPATLAESALPFLLDLKVFGISTYKINRGGTLMNQNRRSRNGSVVAQVAQAFIISGQRDLRFLSCKSAYVAACASPLEYALTQKQGRGYRHDVIGIRTFAAQRSRGRGTPAAKSRSLGQNSAS